jgi:hypothetical protein
VSIRKHGFDRALAKEKADVAHILENCTFCREPA